MVFEESYFLFVLLGICLAPLSLTFLNCLALQLPLCHLSEQGGVCNELPFWQKDSMQACSRGVVQPVISHPSEPKLCPSSDVGS